VLEAWRRYAPQARLIGIGSSCAYPANGGPLTEDRFMEGEIHGSVYAYAFTKRLLWRGISAYNDQHGLDGSYLIPATMFGEHDDFHPDTAHVVGALLGRFADAARNGAPEVEVWGDGSQVREFMDVECFVDALLHLMPRIHRDILNVGPGRGTAIRDLVDAIRIATEYRGRIRFRADRYVGVREKYMDTTKLNHRYAWTVPCDLTSGIKRTADWYRSCGEQVHNRRKFSDPAAPACMTAGALAGTGGC
jgi:GDP-L-fucose synthase